ncbi:protein kinase [Nocardia sp. NBC_01730]|uniref:protein kinase domain-containing protein n=1 Tax=Nocardia sp. NBC_01730 TaxID=2975998 RepID=UPI002E0DAF2E|nr:protein kinase [Nocardia sp. NBC_01730]
MSELDPTTTQRDLQTGLAAELAAAGFFDAEEIGRGGFGAVFRCIERSLDRLVAVKVLNSEFDGEDRARFVREQHALGRLSGHPNIVQILQADITATGKPYIVMPFHARGSLDTQLRTTGPVRWDEVLSIGERVAGALAAAHAAGTIHRDVKPANILRTDYDEPQLADFGIARVGGGFETTTGHITGTPAFTAPEVLSGASPSPASDIYSLGATLFCLLTGHAAFERRTGETVMAQFLRVSTEPIPDLSDTAIPADAVTAIECAMALDPMARPESAAAYQHRLREALRHGGTVTSKDSTRTESAIGGHDLPAQPRRTREPTAPPSASTKYRPPSPPRALVERPRLLRILRAGELRRLTVIRGPAGFGKSTLAAQWARLLEAEQVQLAWLTIDADDNNAVWFLAHLVEAIRRAQPTLAGDLGQILEQHATDATRYVVSALIDEIHTSGETFAVVIDDWHLVTQPATVAAFEFLLDNACHHLRVIVTSRSAARLPLGKMRVRDELVEINSEDLRFDETEASSFLLDINRLLLDPGDIAQLLESTEGWAAALQLASLSLRGRENPSECIEQIAGDSHAISEYLASNVLATLAPDLLDFLLATSVTERVSGDLACVLAEVTCGQEMLEEIENLDLFLGRVDGAPDWFRYHRLFADILRRRLARKDPDRLSRLHRTAAAWFAERRMLKEAVDHALAANDPPAAMHIIQKYALELLERSRPASLLGLLAKFPLSFVTTSPQLQLLVAWANVTLQRLPPARAALDLADALLDSGYCAEAETEAMRAEVALVRATTGFFADQHDELPAIVQDRLRGTVDPYFATAAADVASTAALYRFDFAEARRWQRWAAPYHARRKSPFGVVYGHCLAGLAGFEQLDFAAAESDLRTALAVAQVVGSHSSGARLASALLGAIRYDLGDIADAEALLDESAELGPKSALVEFMMATYGIGTRVKALRGDLDAAETRLSEGAKIADNLGLERLAARIMNERVRIGLPLDPADRAMLLQLPPPHRPRSGLPTITSELQQDTAIRLLLAEHSPDAADEACTRAEALVGAIAEIDRPRSLLLAQLLWAATLSVAGRNELAGAVFRPALARCAEHGLIRPVADEAAQLRTMLAALRADPALAPEISQTFIRRVLAEPGLHRDWSRAHRPGPR